MTRSPRIPHAVVVLPAGRGGRIRRPDQRRWLATGLCDATAPSGDPFSGALQRCGLPVPRDGLAALRLWGQTGTRPAGWVAAADPVHLAAQLDHLRLHALAPPAVAPAELAELCKHLQSELGHEDRYSVSCCGDYAYLRAEKPIATSVFSPQAINGARPEDFFPDGDDSDGHDRLIGEMQMALHDHTVNRQRAVAGRPTVNSLWLWGGGFAPAPRKLELPDLYADDPLWRGYWHSSGGTVRPLPGRLADCLDSAPRRVVAVLPDSDDEAEQHIMALRLDELRRLLGRRSLERLTLLFRDGLAAELGPYSHWQFWHGTPPELCEPDGDE